MRLPIRVRLTAWYAALLAAIIVWLGVFVVLQLRADLQGTVDRELRAASGEIRQGYEAEGPEDFLDVSRTVLPRRDGMAQLLDGGGRVLLSSSETGQPLVPANAVSAALEGQQRLLTVRLQGHSGRFRAMVSPVRRLGQQQVLAVAESLREVDNSVQRVLILLLFAGPAALAATALGGWWLARKALLPVARMTSEAQQIGIDRLDERLAVPRTRDEISHLGVTLNAMLDRLEQGVKEKHQLIADASHELRTPLAAMRTELDVSLQVDELSAGERALLESVREEVDKMSRTVENLLTLAEADEGRLKLIPVPVQLREAIDAAARPLRPLAATKQLRLDIGAEPGETQADPHLLQQALSNLIENAVKYSPAGGEVRVRASRENDEVVFTVSDDGPGIPAEARAHIFDRFYRVDGARSREAGGSGLGLAICREIASAHGGRVWVESEEGRGSAFSLALPAGEAEAMGAPAGTARPRQVSERV